MMRQKMISCKPDGVGQKERLMSRYKFENALTMKDFLLLYSLFYLNEMCIPSYFGTFKKTNEQPTHDNPWVTDELGIKFKDLTLAGVVGFDSQLTIPGIQKGYISAWVEEDLGRKLSIQLNRYDNIVAFVTWVTGNSCVQEMYVSYDAYPNIIEQSAEENVLLGEPSTLILSPDTDRWEFFKQWMSEDVKRVFNEETHVTLNVVATSIRASPTYVVDMVIQALQEIR